MPRFGLTSLLNGMFLLLAVYLVGEVIAAPQRWPERGAQLLAVAIVWLMSVGQAIVEYGDNPRYLVPFQPLIWYVVAVSAWQYIAARRERRCAG